MNRLELGKRLKATEKDLRRYCHTQKCNYIYHCPEQHDKCRQMLDLATSIAWRVANHLADIELDLQHKNDINQSILKAYYYRTHEAECILDPHRIEYSRLRNLVVQARRLIEEVRTSI